MSKGNIITCQIFNCVLNKKACTCIVQAFVKY